MTSILSHIWNGRPAPCEHDALPLARIGTVQPHGVMMVVVPETGAVEHVSANIEDILGVPARAVLGRPPMVAFQDADSVSKLADTVRSGRRFFDNPTMLSARGQRFEMVCHIRDGRLFIEIEPYVEAEHDYQTMVTTAMDAMSRQTTVQGLYETSARLMNFVTSWDRVKLYKFVSHGHGVVVAEQHSANTQLPGSFLGYHFSATDVPEAAKEILRTGKTRQKPTQRGSVPLLTLGAQGDTVESGQSVDMTDAWLRGIHPCDNGYNRNLGVGSNIIFPVCIDNSVWGLFVVHNKEEKFLNYDSRAVIEQLTMMFASRLIELEAHEGRIVERQAMAQQILGMVESAQAMLSQSMSLRGEYAAAIRLQAMQAVSRHVAALAPTYVSSATGCDSAEAGRPEDRFCADLLRLADADGAAIIRCGASSHVHLVGMAPDALTVRGIAAMFGNRLPAFADDGWRVFATDALADHIPADEALRGIASGLLAVPICNRGDMIMWFRRERVIDATWAGKPPTAAERRSEMMFRSRSDFAAHQAPLSGASRPWLEAEVVLAAQFGAALGELWLRQQRGAPAMPGFSPEHGREAVLVDAAGDVASPRAAEGFAFMQPPASPGRWNAVS